MTRPVAQCRCGYQLLKNQDCPECGRAFANAVALGHKNIRWIWARTLLAAGWLLAVFAAFLPAYHGEVSPGAVATLNGLQVVLGGMALSVALDSFGKAIAFAIPLVLLLCTPLALARRIWRCWVLRFIWGLLLILSSLFSIIPLVVELDNPNAILLVGFYLMPPIFLITGTALMLSPD